MNTEHFSQTSAKKSQKKSVETSVEIDDFQLSEESFKPMTKGLGFHHEPKKQAFKPAPQEAKPMVHTKSLPTQGMPASAARTQKQSFVPMGDLSKDNQKTTTNHIPSGLEAFYSTNNSVLANNASVESTFFEEKNKTSTKIGKKYQSAPIAYQLSAYVIDILLICSFVIFTAALLVLASGIEFSMYSRIISQQDLFVFAVAMFSIYYLLYFTILDASSTPGKTIFGLKLVKTDGRPVAVKDSFFRAIISLISGVALFLPLMLDFHGKLTDTKVVK